ncbi:hypothetical protein [Candidatus Mycalebacterium sp.]
MENIAGKWELEGFPVGKDGKEKRGLHRVIIEQVENRISGESYYLIDPATGEANPDPQNSLSKITGEIVAYPANAPENSKNLVTITRKTNTGDLIALFFGVMENQNRIRGYFVNTFGRGGRFEMKRAG